MVVRDRGDARSGFEGTLCYVRIACLLVAALGLLACDPESGSDETPGGSEGPEPRPPGALAGRVVVSLTFDDGFASQTAFFQMLDDNNIESIRGTFYLNSSRLDLEAGERDSRDRARYAPLETWRSAAASGHEIGSHTISHLDLSCTATRSAEGRCQPGLRAIDDEEVRRQICGDRIMLESLGFDVRGLAYPYGRDNGERNPSLHTVVADCGFSYARRSQGLARGVDGIEGRPLAESLPPVNRMSIRSYGSIGPSDTFEDFRRWILDAAEAGRGWVPLVFHDISDDCADPENPGEQLALCVLRGELEALVRWLDRAGEMDGAPPSVLTLTAGEAIEEVNRAVSRPIANGSLEDRHSGSIDRPNCFERLRGRHEANFEWSSAALEAEREASGEGGYPNGARGSFEKLFPTDSHPQPLVQMTTRDDTCYFPVVAGRSYELRVRARSACSEGARGRFTVSALSLEEMESSVTPVWTEAVFEEREAQSVPSEWTSLHWLSPVIPDGMLALAYGFQYIDPVPGGGSGCEIWVDDFEAYELR